MPLLSTTALKWNLSRIVLRVNSHVETLLLRPKEKKALAHWYGIQERGYDASKPKTITTLPNSLSKCAQHWQHFLISYHTRNNETSKFYLLLTKSVKFLSYCFLLYSKNK